MGGSIRLIPGMFEMISKIDPPLHTYITDLPFRDWNSYGNLASKSRNSGA